MRGRADRVEEKRREPVGNVVRDGQEAALGDGEALGVAAGALPADEVAAFAGTDASGRRAQSSHRPQKTGM